MKSQYYLVKAENVNFFFKPENEHPIEVTDQKHSIYEAANKAVDQYDLAPGQTFMLCWHRLGKIGEIGGARLFFRDEDGVARDIPGERYLQTPQSERI